MSMKMPEKPFWAKPSRKNPKAPSAARVAALAIALAVLAPAGAGVSASAGPRAGVGPRSDVGGADPANGVYVSPSGNDSTATGSVAAPFKSINAALAAAGAGGTVVLRGGVYREGANVRVREPNVTIKSREGEWAAIDLTTHNPGNDEDSGVYFDVDSSGGRLMGVEVIGGFYAVCMETKWDWGDPLDRAGASNITIEDCVLHDSKYDVVKVKPNCDNVAIRHNEIYNSGRSFAGSAHNGEENAEGIDNVNGDGMAVQNNYIHDIIGNAVYAKGGAMDALVENNWVERAYGAGIMVGFDASPEFFDLAANPQYYENIRGVVRNNLIIGTGWEGIGLYASKDAQVYNNTLVDVDNGGLYHSAIYFGITLQDWEEYASRPANANPSIHHNIVSQPSSFGRQMVEIRYANELGGLSALAGSPKMGDNCYHVAGKGAGFTDNRPGSPLEGAGLTAWQSHIGGDAGSIEADPALGADYMPANPQCAGMGIYGFSSEAVAAAAAAAQARMPASAAAQARMPMATAAQAPGAAKMADVASDHWAAEYIGYLVGRGVVDGYPMPDGTLEFRPGGEITRAEAIKLIAASLGLGPIDGYDGSAFADWDEAPGWAKPYVAALVEAGIVKGSREAGGVYIFADGNIVREEMVAMAVRALSGEMSGGDATSMGDASGGDAGADADAAAAAAGAPDFAEVSDWARGYMAFALGNGMINVDADGNVEPARNARRDEAAMLLYKLILS